MRHVLAVVVAALLFAGVIAVALLFPSRPAKVVHFESTGVETPEQERIHAAFRAALDRKFDWGYVNIELAAVAADLENRLGLPVRLNRRDLEEVGLSPATPVTFVAKNLSARSFLEIVLTDLGLTYLPYDGGLVISNPDAAARPDRLLTRVYPVPDLRRPETDMRGRWKVNYEPLRQLIQTQIDPPSWSDVGGPCAIEEPHAGALMINQSLAGHERVEFLLTALRQIDRDFAADPRLVKNPVVPLRPREADPVAELPRVDFEFAGTLETWAVEVQEKYGIYVHLSKRDLDEVGLSTQHFVSGRVRAATLRETLREFLPQHGLTYLVRRDYILVTNPDFACLPMNLLGAAFPVWDLAGSMAPDARREEMEKLLEAIQAVVDPSSWVDVGGSGSMDTWLKPATLIVSQTEENLARTAQVIGQIRRARRIQNGG